MGHASLPPPFDPRPVLDQEPASFHIIVQSLTLASTTLKQANLTHRYLMDF